MENIGEKIDYRNSISTGLSYEVWKIKNKLMIKYDINKHINIQDVVEQFIKNGLIEYRFIL